MLARAIEETGLPTAGIVLIKEHAERVKPARALWVPFPFGFALGNPNDPPFQREVLAATLDLFRATSGPVLAEFPEDGEAPARLLQATAARAESTGDVDADAADELTAMRGYYERWVDNHDGRTLVGLTGVPQRRWRGLIKYLQSYAAGDAPAYEEIPADVAEPRFIRLAADDLKAFYMEARMCQRPDQRDNDVQQWFWTETAAGTLLAQIAERMNAAGDDALTRAAFGIAR